MAVSILDDFEGLATMVPPNRGATRLISMSRGLFFVAPDMPRAVYDAVSVEARTPPAIVMKSSGKSSLLSTLFIRLLSLETTLSTGRTGVLTLSIFLFEITFNDFYKLFMRLLWILTLGLLLLMLVVRVRPPTADLSRDFIESEKVTMP